jgi:hypothetical protein
VLPGCCACQPRQKHTTLFRKITKAKRAVGVAQVVELLPSKHKALTIPRIKNKAQFFFKEIFLIKLTLVYGEPHSPKTTINFTPVSIEIISNTEFEK